MRKTYILLVLFLSITLFAQVPEGFNYQATVRNNSGALITNQNVNFKFNVIKDSPTGESVYSETHNVLTDDLGAVNLAIGKGTATTGTFSAIDWGSGNHYLGIELNTGLGYVTMGTTQLLSVPYAMYAKSSGDIKLMGLQTIVITGDISNEQAAAQIAEEAGPLTKNIYVYDTKGLTSLDLNKFNYLESINVNKNHDLTSINADNLLKCQGIDNSIEYAIRIDYNPSLKTISFPGLKSVMNILVQGNTELTSFSAPSLDTVTRSLAISDGNITSIQFPSLSWVGDGLAIYSKLASIEIPSLTHIASYLNLNNNNLPSSQINAILHKMLTILPNPNDGNFYRLDLSQQNPPAPPTGQGITDKEILINNGNNVITD